MFRLIFLTFTLVFTMPAFVFSETAPDKKIFWELASQSDEGFYPSWLYGKQARWTIGGMPSDSPKALLDEFGNFQFAENTFTITPFFSVLGIVQSAAQFQRAHTRESGYLPIPSVIWHSDHLKLHIKVWAKEENGKRTAYLRYLVESKDDADLKGRFLIMVRPLGVFQTPAQNGFPEIKSLQYSEEGQALLINGTHKIYFFTAPQEAGTLPFDGRDMTQRLMKEKIPQLHNAHDSQGLASAAVSFDFYLSRGVGISYWIMVTENLDETPALQEVEKSLPSIKRFWGGRFQEYFLQTAEKKWPNLLRTSAASMLLSQEDKTFCQGSRRQSPCWVSDGLDQAAALLRLGFSAEVKDYLNQVFAATDVSGEVPAALIRQPEESFKEYQSQGKLLNAAWDYYRFTQDALWLKEKYPVIKKTMKFLMRLREQRLSHWYQREDQKKFYGLLPRSNHHRDFASEPQHSYQDILWGLKAFKVGQEAAKILGDERSIFWMKSQEKNLRRALKESMDKVQKEKRIFWIPASPDSVFLDPANVSTALIEAEEKPYFTQEQITASLNRIWKEFENEKYQNPESALRYSDFPVIRLFLRENQKEKALAMFDYQFKQNPPYPWEHWPFLSFTEKKRKVWMDMPDHVKAAAYLQTFRDFFVYESDHDLVLGAGIIPEWIHPKKGLRAAFPTFYGSVDYHLEKIEKGFKVHVGGNAKPRRFIFRSPDSSRVFYFKELPAEFEIK